MVPDIHHTAQVSSRIARQFPAPGWWIRDQSCPALNLDRRKHGGGLSEPSRGAKDLLPERDPRIRGGWHDTAARKRTRTGPSFFPDFSTTHSAACVSCRRAFVVAGELAATGRPTPGDLPCDDRPVFGPLGECAASDLSRRNSDTARLGPLRNARIAAPLVVSAGPIFLLRTELAGRRGDSRAPLCAGDLPGRALVCQHDAKQVRDE